MSTINTKRGKSIFVSSKLDLRDAVAEAVASGVSLQGARLDAVNLGGGKYNATVPESGVELALVIPDASLSHTNWSGAELRNATFARSQLEGARFADVLACGVDFSGAWLRYALFTRADVSNADFTGANLTGVDFSGANLAGANLVGAKFDKASIANATFPEKFQIARLDFGGWSICVYPDKTTIGCETHPNTRWLEWGPDDVAYMSNGAREFWAAWGSVVKEAIRAVMKRAGRGISLTK